MEGWGEMDKFTAAAAAASYHYQIRTIRYLKNKFIRCKTDLTNTHKIR